MYIEPELAQRLCDVYLNYAMQVVKKYIEIGVKCVMIATDWAYNTGPIVSPAIISQFYIPQIKAICDLCHEHDIYVLKHTDGIIMKIADDFFGMGIDAYQGIEPNAGMDLQEIKDKYGDRITLIGNVDCAQILPFGTREEIVNATKDCIRAGAPGGGFILSTSNTVVWPVETDNYKIMLETVREFGKYPIDL